MFSPYLTYHHSTIAYLTTIMDLPQSSIVICDVAVLLYPSVLINHQYLVFRKPIKSVKKTAGGDHQEKATSGSTSFSLLVTICLQPTESLHFNCFYSFYSLRFLRFNRRICQNYICKVSEYCVFSFQIKKGILRRFETIFYDFILRPLLTQDFLMCYTCILCFVLLQYYIYIEIKCQINPYILNNSGTYRYKQRMNGHFS